MRWFPPVSLGYVGIVTHVAVVDVYACLRPAAGTAHGPSLEGQIIWPCTKRSKIASEPILDLLHAGSEICQHVTAERVGIVEGHLHVNKGAYMHAYIHP